MLVFSLCSSDSLEDSESLLLEFACDSTSGGVGLGAFGRDALKAELLLLLDLKQVNFNRVVTIR